MKIELTKMSHSGSTLVAFALNEKAGKETRLKITHPALHLRLKKVIDDKELSLKPEECVLFRNMDFEGYKHVVVVGLSDLINHEQIRRTAAAIHCCVKPLSKTLGKTVATIDFDGIPADKREAVQCLQALVEGLILTDYDFSELKSSKKTDKKTSADKNLVFHILTKFSDDADSKKALKEAHVLAETVNFSRRLGDLPGNLMTPTILANTVVAACRGTGIKAIVWNKARIKKEKMGGLLGVSNGSDQEPRFIILEYKGAAASKKPVAFVGKGLTFDCGGVSIKPSGGMEEMKYDMCGGANVIGAMLAIAKLKLKVNVICLVPSTENMVNGSATKPGDVHTARNGKTFEINNTDAEGRLILSDALCFASEHKPQVIIDAATLTGAMIVALGNTHTGYFTRNKELKEKIEMASEQSGEWVWNMPLCDFHVKDMKGTYADLSNMSSGKGAGSATAAAFLEQFVEEGIPWAHFDIAGTGWAVGNRLPYCPKKGASGAMIRTFVELAKMYV